MPYLQRHYYLQELEDLLGIFTVVALLGPRQCGKSTLANLYIQRLRQLLPSVSIYYFDLENPADEARLMDPQITLQDLEGLIVIDEIQRRPNLFPLLRHLVDCKPQKYLILGSSSRDLIHQSSETLAGRIAYMELPPFTSFEVEASDLKNLWLRGGFPPSFLAKSERVSAKWRQEYIKTYLERDLAAFGFSGIEPAQMRRFWQMLAHYHGQTFNASEIANSLGINHKTARRYLDILHGTFMIRQLRPWFENIGKRQVKSPKVYFRDSGIFHVFLGINNYDQLTTHPKLGASWEGFALEEVIRRLNPDPDDCYFWATSNEAELDLMILKDGRRLGFEFKYSTIPKITKSMKIALTDLKLDKLTIIIPGSENFALTPQIQVSGLEKIPCILSPNYPLTNDRF
ncbi:MAG: putative superfamily ATPase [Candidatus Midichloriaceae bacterium]|jgi:predicted AAA+ superfamily ATPase|nr:putative superfamily ATPase [Candidatus Midichloriaceae bacterium]